MTATATIRGMAKKKTARKAGGEEQPREVIYLEVDPRLKELMGQLARLHNRRLTGECIQAMQDHLARHNLWPPPEDN